MRTGRHSWRATSPRRARWPEPSSVILSENLRALGARPVDIDKVYRRVAGKTSRPSPVMHLLLLGARIARRVEPIETRFITSRPDGRHLIGEARARLKPSRTIDTDDRIRF